MTKTQISDYEAYQAAMQCYRHHNDAAEFEKVRIETLRGKKLKTALSKFDAATDAAEINLAMAQGLILVMAEETQNEELVKRIMEEMKS